MSQGPDRWGERIANLFLRLAWRFGLGWLAGRYVLLLTTVGRKSGTLHRVPVRFVFRGGTFYVMSATGTVADWYRNLEAQPVCTTQTWPGPKAARARRITEPDEQTDVAGLFGRQRGDAPVWVALEPTAQKAPGMLEPDLIWAWPIAATLAIAWSRWGRARPRTQQKVVPSTVRRWVSTPSASRNRCSRR